MSDRISRVQIAWHLLGVMPDSAGTMTSLKETVEKWMLEMRSGMEPPHIDYVLGALQLVFREAGQRGRLSEGVNMEGDTVFVFTPFQTTYRMDGNKKKAIIRATVVSNSYGGVQCLLETDAGVVFGVPEPTELAPVVGGASRRLKRIV